MAFDIAFLVGRIITGGYFLMSGVNHFKNLNMLKGYAASKKVPAAGVAVPLTGLMMLLGGLSLLLGYMPTAGTALLLAFLVPTTFWMHNFWTAPAEHKMAEKINFMKNLALIGLLLMTLAIAQPWAFSF